jgi:hypothetical protein
LIRNACQSYFEPRRFNPSKSLCSGTRTFAKTRQLASANNSALSQPLLYPAAERTRMTQPVTGS